MSEPIDLLAAMEKETARIKADTQCKPDIYIGSKPFLFSVFGVTVWTPCDACKGAGARFCEQDKTCWGKE